MLEKENITLIKVYLGEIFLGKIIENKVEKKFIIEAQSNIISSFILNKSKFSSLEEAKETFSEIVPIDVRQYISFKEQPIIKWFGVYCRKCGKEIEPKKLKVPQYISDSDKKYKCKRDITFNCCGRNWLTDGENSLDMGPELETI